MGVFVEKLVKMSTWNKIVVFLLDSLSLILLSLLKTDGNVGVTSEPGVKSMPILGVDPCPTAEMTTIIGQVVQDARVVDLAIRDGVIKDQLDVRVRDAFEDGLVFEFAKDFP